MVSSCLRRILHHQNLFSNQCISFSTYYDSQSGLHVEIQNEREISVMLDVSSDQASTSDFVPLQLYKEDSSSDMPDKLIGLKKNGITGAILSPMTFPRDFRNLKTLQHIAPHGFKFFTSTDQNESATSLASYSGLSMVEDYNFYGDEENTQSLTTKVKSYVDHGLSTTIKIHAGAGDPIIVASKIATLIDVTGGADVIWLSSDYKADADDMIQMWEELCYLDLPGLPVKSRLMVNVSNDEVVEEAMNAGVNKFVIDNEDQIGLVRDVAEYQGKTVGL